MCIRDRYNQGDDWPDQVDLILGGGGQDTGQKKIIDDFYHRADLLRSLAADGTPMLMICGLYQLFGEYFETVDGTRLDGIGVIGAYTVGQNVQMCIRDRGRSAGLRGPRAYR